MQKNKKIQYFFALMIALVVFGFSSSAKAGVIFEDNFDGYPDWSSKIQYNQTEDTATTKNLIFGGTRAESAIGWDSYRTAGDAHTLGNPTFQLNSTNARGGSGKSLKVWYESNVAVIGGGVNLWFGGAKGNTRTDQETTGYDEIYVRFVLKYDPSWYTDLDSYMKVFRLYTQKAVDWGDNMSTEYNYNYTVPICSFAYLIEKRDGLARDKNGWALSSLDDPTKTGTACLDAGSGTAGGVFWGSMKSDWMIIQVYEKLNTPGQSDGVIKLWVNNNDPNSPSQIKSGLMLRDVATKKWNAMVVLDNLQKYTTAIKTEQFIAMDDLVISTSYVDNNYVIGGTPTYQCSDSKDNDGDGKIDYPADSGCTSATDNDETDIKTYSLQDFINLIPNWLKTISSQSDINNDGTVNSKDLGIMMSNWQ